MLKLGSQGEDVKNLQLMLGITANGIFGIETEDAVKEWQNNHGVVADGVVGPGTLHRIMSNNPLFPEN